MPIYEYRCKKCGRKFETLMLGTEDKGLSCPHCKATAVEKLLSCFSSPASTRPGTKAPSCGSGGGCSCG